MLEREIVVNRLNDNESGQALTEYALMSMCIMSGCVFFFQQMMSAYQLYTKAFYLLVVLPFP